MSTLAPLFTWRSAICESGLPAATRHVALTISLHMNERGGSAFPGPTRLARETGLHVSTVKEKLAELERAGWLRCVTRGGRKGERKCANEYVATIPEPTLGFPQPVAHDDPSPQTTRRPSPRAPVAQGDPSSSTEYSNKKPRKQRPTVDYEPTDTHRSFAAEHGLDLDAERAHWVDWCEANGRTYQKLNAGFSTWLHNAVRFGRGNTRPTASGRPTEPRRCTRCANTGNYFNQGQLVECWPHVYT